MLFYYFALDLVANFIILTAAQKLTSTIKNLALYGQHLASAKGSAWWLWPQSNKKVGGPWWKLLIMTLELYWCRMSQKMVWSAFEPWLNACSLSTQQRTGTWWQQWEDKGVEKRNWPSNDSDKCLFVHPSPTYKHRWGPPFTSAHTGEWLTCRENGVIYIVRTDKENKR